MSYVSDSIDQFVLKLQGDGPLIDIVNPTSIKKGVEPEFPDNIAQNQFPIVRVTWSGTTEEDEAGDVLPERYVTVNLLLHLAVRENDEVKRLEALADLDEKVKNAIYRGEIGSQSLVADEINVSLTEVAPDLFSPYGLAVMEVALMGWVVRDGRAGR
jgi:hypothetical protein